MNPPESPRLFSTNSSAIAVEFFQRIAWLARNLHQGLRLDNWQCERPASSGVKASDSSETEATVSSEGLAPSQELVTRGILRIAIANLGKRPFLFTMRRP